MSAVTAQSAMVLPDLVRLEGAARPVDQRVPLPLPGGDVPHPLGGDLAGVGALDHQHLFHAVLTGAEDLVTTLGDVFPEEARAYRWRGCFTCVVCGLVMRLGGRDSERFAPVYLDPAPLRWGGLRAQQTYRDPFGGDDPDCAWVLHADDGEAVGSMSTSWFADAPGFVGQLDIGVKRDGGSPLGCLRRLALAYARDRDTR